jgi:HlyD family secretion protein
VDQARDNHATGTADSASATLRERVRSLRLPDKAASGASASSGLVQLLLLLNVLFVVAFAATGYVLYGINGQLEALRGDSPALGGELSRSGSAGASGADATRGMHQVASSGEVALERSGFVMAAHLILVSPKVGGMVTKLNIEEGMRVKKSDVLAELETIEFLSDRDRAKATLEMARERLRELERGNRPEEIEQSKREMEEMEAQREQLYADWRRNTNLKTGSALAQRDYEQALGAYKAMDRRVERMRLAYKLMVDGPRIERIEASRAELRQAEAELVKAQWRLDNTKVTAPVSGTILSKKAEEGNMINPSAFSNGLSASLCEMADLSDLEVDLSIEERDIARVFKGQRCKARPDAYQDRVYEGVVSRLMPQADRAKGAVPVRVKLTVPREEEGVYLKPDMRVTVSFLKGKQ